MSDDILQKPLPKVFIYAPGCQYLLPYIERELCDNAVVTDFDAAADSIAAVMISSIDAYQYSDGEIVNENFPLNDRGEVIDSERLFAKKCSELRLPSVILRCPQIIATGMTGLMRTLAEGIASSRFFRLNGDDEAHLAVVHAVDIAQAVRLSLGKTGEYIVADGQNPSITELSDALAYRIADKRILVARNKWIRWMVPNHINRQLAACPQCSPQRIIDELGFSPTSVTDYLRTHVYDENSL